MKVYYNPLQCWSCLQNGSNLRTKEVISLANKVLKVKKKRKKTTRENTGDIVHEVGKMAFQRLATDLSQGHPKGFSYVSTSSYRINLYFGFIVFHEFVEVALKKLKIRCRFILLQFNSTFIEYLLCTRHFLKCCGLQR